MNTKQKFDTIVKLLEECGTFFTAVSENEIVVPVESVETDAPMGMTTMNNINEENSSGAYGYALALHIAYSPKYDNLDWLIVIGEDAE